MIMKKIIIQLCLFIVSASIIGCSENRKSDSKVSKEISNQDSIEKAKKKERALKAKKKREKKEKLDSLKVALKPLFKEKYDDFTGSTWVHLKSEPPYRNQNAMYAYFMLDSSKKATNFRFVYQYYADDWLFIDQMTFNIDGENINISPDFKHDNSDGMIWEWCDASVGRDYYNDIPLSFIKKLIKGKKVKVRLYGSTYRDDRAVTQNQIKMIKNVYNYYVALGGTF